MTQEQVNEFKVYRRAYETSKVGLEVAERKYRNLQEGCNHFYPDGNLAIVQNRHVHPVLDVCDICHKVMGQSEDQRR